MTSSLGEFVLKYRLGEIFQTFFIFIAGFIWVSHDAPNLFAFAFAWAVLFQIFSSFVLNDYFDWFADLSNSRKIAHASRPPLLIAAILLACASMGTATLISKRGFFLVLAANLVSVLYSAPPFRLKLKKFAPALVHLFMGALYSYCGILAGRDQREPTLRPIDFMFLAAWALILMVGSIGNERVDSEADVKAGIETLSNAYPPETSLYLIYSFNSIAMALLLAIAFQQEMRVSRIVIPIVFVFYTAKTFGAGKKMAPQKYRRIYRWFIGFALLVFTLERAI